MPDHGLGCFAYRQQTPIPYNSKCDAVVFEQNGVPTISRLRDQNSPSPDVTHDPETTGVVPIGVKSWGLYIKAFQDTVNEVDAVNGAVTPCAAKAVTHPD
jgi:hypothetical protein